MLQSLIKGRTFVLKAQALSYRSTGTVAATKAQDVMPFSDIPKLPTFPLIGSAWVYLPVIGKYDFWKLHKANKMKYEEYGPIIREKFSSNFSATLIYDAEDVAKIYRSEGKTPERRSFDSIRGYREKRKDVYANVGLLTSQGKEWYQMRSEVQPHMMKPKAVHAYLKDMDDVVAKFVDRVSFLRKENGGEVPDLMGELNKFALETVGIVALDARLGCLEIKPNEEALKVIKAVKGILKDMISLEFSTFNLWKHFRTPTYRRFSKNMDYFTDTVYKYLVEAKNRLKDIPEDHEATFLELMISTAKDPSNINATIIDMFLGGIETSANTVGFTLYHLARNPDAQEKAYQEVKNTLKGNTVDVDALNKLRYIKACVKESMRLSPVALGSLRTLSEDLVLSGYSVPAGTVAFIQAYTIFQNEKHFPEPKSFRPERFLRDEMKHDPFAFLPFGFGPRSCIGKRIAEQEIWTLLTRIIQKFRVEYHHEDIDVNFRGVGSPDKPLRFQFYDR